MECAGCRNPQNPRADLILSGGVADGQTVRVADVEGALVLPVV